MTLALIGAFAAAGCYGGASVLQALAARRTTAGVGVDPRLLWRLVHSLPYLCGLALDLVAFGLSLAALRALPLFVVQAAIASSLAVTAVLAGRFLGAHLGRREWGAVGAVCAGLVLLAVVAGADHPVVVGTSGRLLLLTAVAVLAAAGLRAGATRRAGATAAGALGAVAGLGFGAVSVAARILREPTSMTGLLADPATYTIAAAGLLGTLCYATALQRGSVTSATAALVVGETALPALVGVTILGDRARPGLAWLGVVGFVITVAGALMLSRYGEPDVPAAPDPAAVRPVGGDGSGW